MKWWPRFELLVQAKDWLVQKGRLSSGRPPAMSQTPYDFEARATFVRAAVAARSALRAMT